MFWTFYIDEITYLWSFVTSFFQLALLWFIYLVAYRLWFIHLVACINTLCINTFFGRIALHIGF